MKIRGHFLLLKTAWRSLLYRKSAVVMAILSVAMSVYVLLGVEHIRKEARSNFTNTISGVDLIAGPRTGQINLLLYSVFRMGTPTNNISWQSFQAMVEHPNVNWAIPISLGDSHKGFRVVGTNQSFFKHFRYGSGYSLAIEEGVEFTGVMDVVLGAKVARELAYALGDKVILAHGIAKNSFALHKDRPFNVVGVLKSTGTPVDNALYVSLEGIEAIHKNWQGGVQLGKSQSPLAQQDTADLTPKSVTAAMLGLNSKLATFKVQRWINNYNKEPLIAILPGVVLVELWQMMGKIEKILMLVSSLIFVSALFGIAAMLLSSMRERKRELLILRSLGASPLMNYWLLSCEALLITLLGSLIAVVFLLSSILIVNNLFSTALGMSFSFNLWSVSNGIIFLMMIVSVFLICLIPAVKIYREIKRT